VQAQPVSAPVVQPVVKPTPGAVAEDVAKKEIQEIEQESSTQQSQVGELLDTKLQTDVQKKFGELFFTTKNIYLLKEKIGTGGEETFDIL